MSILDTIVKQKHLEIAELSDTVGLTEIKRRAAVAPERASFYGALSKPGVSLIAELKKASPSKGVIRENFDPVLLAQEFVGAGASALSVLTDEQFFQGAPAYLEQVSNQVSCPLLRKEFIIDPIQVYHAKALGASAILLIKAILSISQAQVLMDVAAECGLDVLMEIHNQEELDALSSLRGLSIIGVNNRNLNDFHTDTNFVLELAPKIRQQFSNEILVVAESGYQDVSQIEALAAARIDAVLIGEGLARYPDLQSFWAK